MGLPAASPLTGVNLDQASGSGTRLDGPWLILARMLSVAMFIFTLAIFVTSLLVNRFDLVLTVLLVAATSVWFSVSAVLFWRKPTDRVILLFSLALMLLGRSSSHPFPHHYPRFPWPGSFPWT